MKSEWQVNSVLIIGLTFLFSVTYAEITRECERALEKDTKTLQVENEKCEQEFGDDLPCGNLCLLRAKGFIDSESDEFQTGKYLKYMKIYPKNVVQKLHKEIPKCEDYYVPVPAPTKEAERETCKQNEKFLACLENALMNACKKPNATRAIHSRKASSRRVDENENDEDEEDEVEETPRHRKKVTATANRHDSHIHGHSHGKSHRAQKPILKKKSRKTPVSHLDEDHEDEDQDESENESEKEPEAEESEDADLQSETSALNHEDSDNELDDEKTTSSQRRKRQADPDTTPDPGAPVDDTTVAIPLDDTTPDSGGGGGGGGADTTPDPIVDPPVDPVDPDPPADPLPPVDATMEPPPDQTDSPPMPAPDSAAYGELLRNAPPSDPYKPSPGNDKLALLQGLTDDVRAQLMEDREPPPEQIQDLENVVKEVRDHPEAHQITSPQIHEVGTVLDNLREKLRKMGRSVLGIDRIDDFLSQIKNRVPDDFTLPPGDQVTVIPEIHFPSEVAGGNNGGGAGGGGRGGGGAGGMNTPNDPDASARRKEKWIRRRAELVARRGTTKFGKNGSGGGGFPNNLQGHDGGLGNVLGSLGRYGRIRNRLGRLRGRLGRGGRFGRRGRGRRGRLGLRGLKRRGGRTPVSQGSAYRRFGSQVFEQKLLIEVKNPNNIKDFQVTFKGIPNAEDGN